NTSGYASLSSSADAAELAPRGPFQPFPSLTTRSPGVPADTANTDFNGNDWRAVRGLLGRINLSRFLPPYPHQGSGTTRAASSSTPMVTHGLDGRSDGAAQQQFQAAQTARQQLADEIYRRLLAVTGVAKPVDATTPTDVELMPRRWLAQLAVNIVDYIDE